MTTTRSSLSTFLSCAAPAAALSALASLWLGGCAVGPDYRRPSVQTPTVRFTATDAGPSELAELPWWDVFKDAPLQALIRVALTNSYDLAIVLSRVDQARALESQTRSQYLPNVNYGGIASRGENAFLSLPTVNGGEALNSYFAGVQAVWELDLWGRVRRMNESTRARFMAVQESRRDVTVSLVGGVAAAYFELLELDEELAIARRTEESYRRTSDLFARQHADGLASKLEVSRAKAALCAVSARVPDLERQIGLKENALNALLGRLPGPVARSAVPPSRMTPVEIPAGLPSALIERRPDIRAAEQQVRAANAEVGVTVGDFFPRIGLTALVGSTSTELESLTKGDAFTWSLATGTFGPVFTAGRLRARHRQAIAACEEAKLNYQKTALNAFREVADALTTRAKLGSSYALQAEAVQAGRDAVQVATDRYAAGKACYYEVLEAQQQLFPAENALAQLAANRLLAVVQLYKALGGGWSLMEKEGDASSR